MCLYSYSHLYLAGYSWYHISSFKKNIEDVQNVKKYVEKTQQTLSASAALAYLRGVAKSYVAIIPGARFYIDEAFDMVDGIFEAHQEEANAITQKAYDNIHKTIRQSGEDDSLQTAIDILSVFKGYFIELQGLGVKASRSALSIAWDKSGAMNNISGL